MQEQKLYQKYLSGHHWEKHPTAYATSFAKFLEKKNFKGLVVDAGCGNGRDTDTFSKLGFDVLGIDNSNKQISSNKKELPELKFEAQDLKNLKFENESIDAFFSINVMHYVDKKRAIKELFRTLKPQGYFLVHFNIEIIDKDGNVDYRQNQEDILETFSEFEILQKKVFERIDHEPVKHKHKIMELILQKP